MRTNRTRTRAAWLADASFVVADWVCLAATPTFAVLALLAAAPGSSHEMMGSTAHASPLNGMVLMYVLMSAFHTPPWLKLVSRRSRSCKHTKRPGLTFPWAASHGGAARVEWTASGPRTRGSTVLPRSVTKRATGRAARRRVRQGTNSER